MKIKKKEVFFEIGFQIFLCKYIGGFGKGHGYHG